MNLQVALPVALFICIGWIFSVCIHEFGHAIVAYWGGDTSVKDKGYLTLNPAKYIDLNGSIVLPVVLLLLGGVALPGAAVYIQRGRLHNRGWQSAVSAAGPLASILVTFLLVTPFWLGLAKPEQGAWPGAALAYLALLQIAAVLLNLLPIPPLDGYGIFEPWLPPSLQKQMAQFSRNGIFIVFAVLWFSPQANHAFWDITYRLGLWAGVPLELAAVGHELFRRWATIFLFGMIAVAAIVRQILTPKVKHR